MLQRAPGVRGEMGTPFVGLCRPRKPETGSSRAVHGQGVYRVVQMGVRNPVSEPSPLCPSSPRHGQACPLWRKDFWGGEVLKGIELHSGVSEVWDCILPLPFTFRVPVQASGFSPGKGRCGTPGQAVVGTARAVSKWPLSVPFSEECEIARCYVGSPSLHRICPERPSLGWTVR